MGAFLFYLLKSGCCLVVFYIFFKLLMSRSTFFHFNRITLLVGLLGCTLLPLIELTTTEETFLHTPLYAIHEILQSTESVILNPEQMEDPILISEKNPEINSLNWIPVTLAFIYGVGALVTLIWLSLSTCRLIQLIRTSEKKQFGNYVLVIPQQPTASFSWGKYIVISAADYSQQSEEILLHEMMHLRNHHTLDLLFMQIFLLVYWFNPVVWLLKRELQEVHEFEADNGVINTGIDATKYQLLLVKKAVGSRVESIANSFNHSKLKNRITMMLKEKSNRWARLKILLFLPLAVLIAQAFARPEVASSMEKLASFDKVNQIPDKPEKWTEDFFQQTWKEYFGDRVENVKLEKERVLNLYINRKNILLIVNNLLADNVTWDQLADKLAAQLKGMHTRFSPVYIVMMRDKETSDKKWQDLLNIVGEVCDRFTTEVRQQLPESDRDKMDKKFPVLVNIAKPHITEPYLDPSLVQAPPPPPAYPINLIYKTAEGKAVHLRAVNIEQLGEKLEKEGRPISQGDIELQIKGRLSKDKIVSFLKDKGIQPTLISQETGALPQLTMVFTYNSGLQARRDVWKYENAVSFIDQIRTDKVKNVELEIFEKVRPETIAKVRAYLQSKGITNISEKKILFK